MIDFSTSALREGSNAEKYVLREQLFGTSDVLPAWVADMDINTPDFVLDAVKKRLEHPVMGYEEVPESAFMAQIAWMKKRHGLSLLREELFYSHSVVASIHVAIEAFTQVGDGVIVQTPVYPPFFHSVKNLGRKVVANPLKLDEHGRYSFDIEDLQKKIDTKTKLLLLCSPHNPVGRVWRKEELLAIAEVCKEHNIVVFADEIHCDLVYAPNKHTPFASLNETARNISLTAIGVGKTFNMAGFAMSSVAVPNALLREQFKKAYERVHFAQGASLSHVAFEAAYTEGEAWVDALRQHLFRNYQLLKASLEKYGDFIKVTPIEGTYLAWLNCRGMGLRERELREFFIYEAKLGLGAGISFGKEGAGFMRLNFAVASDTMAEIVQRLEKALGERFGTN